MSARDEILSKMPVDKKRKAPEDDEDRSKTQMVQKKVVIKKEPEEKMVIRCVRCNARAGESPVVFSGPIVRKKKTTLIACTQACMKEYRDKQCHQCKHYHPFPGRWNYGQIWFCSGHCYIEGRERLRNELQAHLGLPVKKEPAAIANDITALAF